MGLKWMLLCVFVLCAIASAEVGDYDSSDGIIEDLFDDNALYEDFDHLLDSRLGEDADDDDGEAFEGVSKEDIVAKEINSDLNYPEFAGDLDDDTKYDDEIVEDAKNILEEKNGPFEEDFERENEASSEILEKVNIDQPFDDVASRDFSEEDISDNNANNENVDISDLKTLEKEIENHNDRLSKGINEVNYEMDQLDDIDTSGNERENVASSEVAKAKDTNGNRETLLHLLEIANNNQPPFGDIASRESFSEEEISDDNKVKEFEKPSVNYDDYLVEDNRSGTKEEIKKDDVINYPEFAGSLEENRDQVNNDQIRADVKKILEEENTSIEDDFESDDMTSIEGNDKKPNTSEFQDDDDDGNIHKDYIDDVIENQLHKEIETYLTKIENIRHQIDSENSEQEDESLAIKYENDMIDPNEIENLFDNTDENNDQNENSEEIDDDEDTVDKVYKDLNADLDKLFETWDKLTADGDDTKTLSEETINDSDVKDANDDIEEYEEKFDRPYKEGVVLQQRDELYDDLNNNTVEINSGNDDRSTADSNESIQILFDPYQNLDDKFDESEVDSVEENKSDNSDSDNSDNDSEKLLILQIVDAQEKVTGVTKDQYLELMAQFSEDHREEIETKSSPPTHMDLYDDKIVEIESPNYPNSYPTNNVVDWIVQGDGSGIELNITDLSLRGAQGDYLLIRPGGTSEARGGLIFSYDLTLPQLRHYRFTDVSHVYIRFVSGTGLNFLPGFHLTVKQIWPPTDPDDEEFDPEAQVLLPESDSWAVSLGVEEGNDYQDFKEQFRLVIADMATMFINDQRIDPGRNTTREVTRISTASCLINWPNAEKCITVKFRVPLIYEDLEDDAGIRLNRTDLEDMWNTYVTRDPFAARLRSMGITQFPVPNDRRMMGTWALLTVAVIIAAAFAGFGLWRYSFAEDYTRMKDFNDTDSIGGKRGLDLYPTPHQPLPPLYSEKDFQWADSNYEDSSRVDLGGHTNRSYARDELLDIESDEEVAPRDRYTTDV